MIKVRVPATSANLGPGFDCLGLALKLYLNLEIEETAGGGLEIKCEGEGAEQFPADESNLIWRSINLVWQKFKKVDSQRGLKIRALNEIPVTRGLGSSAAALIGSLVGINKAYHLDLTEAEIIDLALPLEGHTDNLVPALVGGLTISYKNEKGGVSWSKIKPVKDLRVVLAVPDFTLSTEKMRKILPSQVSRSDAIFNLSRVSLLVKALQDSDWGILAAAMEDKLHQPFRAPFIPGMEAVFSKVKRTGLAGIALSGSGPSVISLTKKGSEEIISKIMKDTFREAGVNCRILVLEVDGEGTKIEGR